MANISRESLAISGSAHSSPCFLPIQGAWMQSPTDINRRIAEIAIHVIELERSHPQPHQGPHFQCDLLMMAPLLDHTNAMSQQRLDNALYAATMKDDLEVIKLLLREDRMLSQEGLDIAVNIAMKNINREIVQFLLSEGRMLSQNGLATAVRWVTNIEMIRLALNAGGSFSQESVEKAVKAAIWNKNMNIIELLLSEGRTLSQEGWERVVSAAVWGNHSTLVKFLLSEGKTLSKEGLETTVREAADNNNIAMVKLLLQNGKTLTKSGLMRTIFGVIAQGQCAILHLLLTTHTPLTQEELVRAVSWAIKQLNLDIVKLLLSEDRTLTLEEWGREIGWAAEQGALDIVQFLLRDERTLGPEILEWAVFWAAGNNKINTIRFLLSKIERINSNWLGLSIYNAVTNNCYDAIQFLLSEGRVLEREMLSREVVHAAGKGFLSIVECLLQQGPISISARDSAITNASGVDKERIRDILSRARIYEFTSDLQTASTPFTDVHTFIVNVHDLAHCPANYLRTLYTRDSLPVRMAILDDKGNIEPAIDLGGVTKQVITSLCEALLIQKQIYLTDEGLPYITTQPGQTDVYTHLGHLVSLVYASNYSKKDPLCMGPIFDVNFLKIVKAIALAADEKTGFQQACRVLHEIQPTLRTAINFILDPTTVNKHAYLEIMSVNAEEDALLPDDSLLTEAHKHIQPYYDAACSFLIGTTETFQRALETVNLSTLCRSFQGMPVSIKGILLSLCLAEGTFSSSSQYIRETFTTGTPEALQALQDTLRHQCDGLSDASREKLAMTCAEFSHKVDWLIEIIASKDIAQESDLLWLQKFIFAITSKKTLLNTIIRLKFTRRPGLTFAVQTCYNSLDLPTEECSRQDFACALDIAIGITNYTRI